jgi:radical SAM superfamily enzyme YgiQ (UPF0313 family)
MERAGCVGIQIGVESGDRRVLEEIRKAVTPEQVERVARWTSESGLAVACSLIIGHPSDTRETIRATIRLATRLQRRCGAEVMFSVFTPFPGT